MGEADLTALYEMLLGSGLDIHQMNAVRKRFSRWAAGRLALGLAPSAIHCLAISDVPGDELGVIGSGPCVPDPTRAADVIELLRKADLETRLSAEQRQYLKAVAQGTIPETPKPSHPAFAHVTARVIGSNDLALRGALEHARSLGVTPEIASEPLGGDAAAAGKRLAHQLIEARRQQPQSPRCLLWGGETTVTLSTGQDPRGGGRSQELALAAARELDAAGEDARGIVLLAAGTDGRDGATNAAGACVDSGTWSAIAHGGRDPAAALARHESNGALASAGAHTLIPAAATGTNVSDVAVGVIT
jgi:glycerate-2-kinase